MPLRSNVIGALIYPSLFVIMGIIPQGGDGAQTAAARASAGADRSAQTARGAAAMPQTQKKK